MKFLDKIQRLMIAFSRFSVGGRGSGWMKSEKDLYTLVVLPDPTSSPYRFSVRKTTFKLLAVSLSVLFLAVSGLLIHYVFLTGKMDELKDLRKETGVQKQQLQSFASELVGLKKQIVRLKEMDAKLRVITDIGPPSGPQEGLGVGGAETSGLFETDMGIRADELAGKMEEELSALKLEAGLQEVSLEELTQSIKDKKVVWDSTPSVWPVRGWLSSGYGKRISPFTGRLAMHKGIDIATRRDTEITAPASGVVAYKGYDSGLGRLIKINHGYGIQTLYGHLAKDNVRIGQKIKRGDVIGYVGNTGMSTGPHLHYEVFVNGLPVNPLRYIIN
jgi:murein DD-endopeptidase MepM/ murein hydrolase activator NlpD